MSLFHTYQTFTQIVPEFLAERKLFLRSKTYTNKEGRLERFGQWLEDNKLSDKPLKDISARSIGQFTTFLAASLDKPTCQKYVGSLVLVWRYAKKAGEYPDERDLPFNMVVIPGKKCDNSPQLIPKDAFDELVQDMKERDPQLYVASMIQYYAFARPGRELLNLTTDVFDFEQRIIHISQMFAKTKVARTPTITEDLYDILKWYELDKAPDGKYLFHRRRKYSDYPVSQNNLPYRFMWFRKKHKLPAGVVFYSWKHTGITDMLNSGVPLIAVMQQAGHTRLSSTQHYAKKYAGIVNRDLLNYRRSA